METVKQELWLRELSISDDLEGLKFLKELVNEKGIREFPAPRNINENSYGVWLQSKVDMAKGIKLPKGFIPCTTYWVMLDNKIIGIANIKHYLNEYLRKEGGHIGLAIAKDYRGRGIGLKTAKLLVEKARNEFGIEDILFTNNPENTASRNMCENLGAELTDVDGHCHYWLKKVRLNTERY